MSSQLLIGPSPYTTQHYEAPSTDGPTNNSTTSTHHDEIREILFTHDPVDSKENTTPADPKEKVRKLFEKINEDLCSINYCNWENACAWGKTALPYLSYFVIIQAESRIAKLPQATLLAALKTPAKLLAGVTIAGSLVSKFTDAMFNLDDIGEKMHDQQGLVYDVEGFLQYNTDNSPRIIFTPALTPFYPLNWVANNLAALYFTTTDIKTYLGCKAGFPFLLPLGCYQEPFKSFFHDYWRWRASELEKVYKKLIPEVLKGLGEQLQNDVRFTRCAKSKKVVVLPVNCCCKVKHVFEYYIIEKSGF